MGRRCAIAIGVRQAGKLPELDAAITDARKFQAWANKAKYDKVHLIDDEAAPVTLQQIKAVVDHEVESDDLDRLLIFFSGHGTSNGSSDYWLLSNYHLDGNEAVNVAMSFNIAKRLPIRQIGVFADACRSAVPDLAFINGGSIFPRRESAGETRPKWDIYNATSLGDIAQEVPGDGDLTAFGIFSRCLFKALEGHENSILERREDLDVLCSDRLAGWIETTVPDESGRTPNARVQIPDILAGWLRPDDVYLEITAPPPIDGLDAIAHAAPPPGGVIQWTNALEPGGEPVLAEPPHRSVRADEAQEDLQARLQERAQSIATEGRGHFETRRGLTIYGSGIIHAVAARGPADLFEEGGVQHIRGEDGAPAYTVILQTAENTWIPTVILPGFIGVVTVESGLATALNYQVIDPLHYSPDDHAEDLVRRWTALMSLGRGSRKELRELADVTRSGKHDNPALGVLAGYTYERAGDVEDIDSIVGHFADRKQPVLFDLAMLSSFRTTRVDSKVIFPDGVKHFGRSFPAEVAGSFPLLAQGWAILDSQDSTVHPALPGLRSGVLESLWTTLKPGEGADLATLIANGEL